MREFFSKRILAYARNSSIATIKIGIAITLVLVAFLIYKQTNHYMTMVAKFNESIAARQRDKAAHLAIIDGRSVGGEAGELAVRLSSVLAERDLTANEQEIALLNSDIDQLVGDITRLYIRQLARNMRPTWELSVNDLARGSRLTGENLSEILQIEFCYEAFSNQFWETAVGHCLFQALNNDAQAQFYMGRIYQNGWGVSVNPLYAYAWFMISASNEYILAVQLRDELSDYLTADEMREARRLASQCVDSSFENCFLDIYALRSIESDNY